MALSPGLVTALTLLTAGWTVQETTCTAPLVPVVERPVKPVRPTPPSCIDEGRNRHNCSNRIIGAYNAEMESYGRAFDAYVAAVNGYGRALATYVEAVNTYVHCEQRVVMPTPLIEG
ncbi:MAG: hypothetical protein Q8M32_12680 [Brevundimonas sp.]|nr:hypothetical protein [Brevundimonas sp.]